MKGFIKLMRIAGVNFPVAASFIQISNEIAASKVEERLNKLEDPISFLHEDIPKLSQVIYIGLNDNQSTTLSFREDVYDKYSRAFAVLSSEGFIEQHNQAGTIYPFAITVIDETYIAYLCARFENKEKMDKLVSIVDSCKVGKWLNGKEIAAKIELPIFVVQAVFKIYESREFGFVSKTIGESSYQANA
jgi:hypothetical protein